MKKWKTLSAYFLVGTACIANGVNAAEADLMREGFFVGLGGGYNSINLTQNSWGKGISNIITSTGADSNGVAQGTGAPFHDITNTFSPELSIGYFKHFNCSQNLYGFKFIYQYLDSTATNPNLYIPQLGTSVSSTGVTSSLFGYVIADSVQVATNHQMNLLAFIGQSFGNKYFYIGAGPAVFNLQSKNYYSIGYAEFEGATLNVTGLVSYSTPSVWLFGGAAQLGVTYFVSPTWFIDLNYNYAITGSKTINHQQTFANSSSLGSVDYSTSGTLYTKDTLRVNNQSIGFSINKVLDFI